MNLPKKKYANKAWIEFSKEFLEMNDYPVEVVLDSEGMKQLADEIELVECRLSALAMQEKLDLRRIVKFLRGD